MEGSYKTEINKTMSADWQHDKVLGDCMIVLYENNLWTDVKFRCSNHDDHERIHAHKIVLAARSPVFQAMFFGPCAQSNEEIELDNTEAETFDLFLRFIYQDEVTLSEDIAPSVLKTAHYYQVTNLVLYCAEFLASCITSHNVCEILNLAIVFKVTSLDKACCVFIDENADEVMESEGFLKLTENSLTYVLKGDTLFADEVDIFKKAEEWAHKKIEERNLEQNGQNIRKVLGESFFHLRLPTMSLGDLLECTRRKGYFSAEEYEDLAEFINRRSCSTVISNSCIRRLPTEEFIVCNGVQIEDVTIGTIETSFRLTVTRDVKVTTVELAEICAYLKFDRKHYSGDDDKCIKTREKYLESFFDQYRNNVIRLSVSERRYLGSDKEHNFYKLEEQHGLDLPYGLEFVLSGNLKVTCYENKKELITETNNTNEDAENRSLLGLPCETEDENSETLVYEQDLKLNITIGTRHVINLIQPLMLEKSRSPYIFKVNIESGRATSVQLKTVKSSINCFTSKHGVVKVENLLGNFTGIRSITFENVSYRD